MDTAPTRSTLQRWMIVLIALLAPTLGGGTQRWAQGVILVLLAMAVLMQPPHLFVGRVFTGIAVAALVLAAVAWLPATLFGETWWRGILVQELGIKLPNTFSAQPWLSADSFILLSAGILWLLLLGGREWSNTERRWMARKVCGGLMVLTLIWLIVHYAGWHVPIWVCDRNFGPFPNRNQTGDLLATWAVVAAACAVEDFRRGRWSGGVWTAGTLLFLWGLIVNYSRAGVLLFFLGLMGWGIIQLLKTRSVRFVAIGSAGVLVAGSIFFLFGGSTLERFTSSQGFLPDPMQDYRALVFRDAWQMAVRSPWCGVGLGNFEGMFTLARSASANQVRLLHPESDWLWLLDEMGWFGPLLGLGLAGLFIRRAFPLERKSAPTLRSAAAVGALLFAFHGFFDVSGHRLGSALPGLMLFGIAARIPWTAAPSVIQPWMARAGAAMLAVFGIGWIVATTEQWVWPGSLGVKVLNARARAANEAEHFDETIREMDRAIALAALDWQNHYLRGVAHLFAEQFAEAEQDFRRSRRLEPSIASAPYEEGRMWLYFDPPHAKDAWAEALRREPAQNVSYYRRMLGDVGDRPELRKMLRELVGNRTDLLLEWLATSSAGEFRPELERLKSEGNLSAWTPAQLGRLFDAWLRSGDAAGLIEALQANPSWHAAGWRQLAAAYAAEKNFRGACETVHRSQPAAVLPDLPERSEAEAAREFSRSPRDFISGYQLYRAQARAGDWNAAVGTLDRLATFSDAPPYLGSLRADALEHLERWPEAWATLSKTLRQ